MSSSPRRAAEGLAPVGLAELERSPAALLDRVDRKYLVPAERYLALADRLAATHRVLEVAGTRAFRYHTTYYDTTALDAYRHHVQRRRRRFKCRSRRYEDSGACAFEVKLKGVRGRTVKHRMPYEHALHGTLSPAALRFVHERLVGVYGRGPAATLGPSLAMEYSRVTFADVERGERLTCDFELAFTGGGRLAGGAVILESKSLRGAGLADRVLRELGERPVEACSKYCLGIAMTRPQVPVNPFRRLLGRWFVPAAAAAALFAAPAPTPAAASVARIDIDGPRSVPHERKAAAHMRIVVRGRTVFRGAIGIRVRGQASRRHPKRQYAVETRRAARLLGLPREDDWVLSAGWLDKSLMRNALGFAAARRLGRYASRTRFAEVRLNGRYQGVYTLLEQPELGRARVHGRALLELTEPHKLRRGDRAFRTPGGALLAFADPERPARAAARRIAAAAGAAETAMARGDLARLDVGAAVDHVLLSELLKNQDAFVSSTFVALDGRDRLVPGPLWDLDLALGSAVNAGLAAPEGWVTAGRPWSGALLAQPAFRNALAARWATLRHARLVERLLSTAARWEADLAPAARRNFRRWPGLGRRLVPGGTATGSFGAEVAHVRDWLTRRAAWLDRELAR